MKIKIELKEYENLSLKTYKECFSLLEENNVISFEELSHKDDQSEYDNDNSNYDNEERQYICILCAIRPRNVYFEKCGHCCICEKCLEKCLHKYNKKENIDEYFCPLCNTRTKKDDTLFSGIRKIFFA